ncbi:MAG TPA: tripartite tricarboxylate transporter substrate binding protein [Burkholderiales bacterium]|nr:tripartite tricarboxylate transporter substrate binding protein [Burkholderiales bacterium]
MKKTTEKLAGFIVGAVLACGMVVAADKPAGFPTHPIRIIVGVAPGAGTDTITRAVAQMMTERWGQNAIVDNRTGGGGIIATQLVVDSAPDGYTIMSQGETVLLQGALNRVPYNPLKKLEPIVGLSQQPYILLVNLSLPIKSMKDLIEYSKTRPIDYAGSSGIGSPVHLGMERFAQMTGAKLQYVAYKGSAPAILAVIGGEIQLALGSSIAGSAAMRTGKVRGLAVAGLKRIPSLPDLPTVAEQGFPGFTISNRYVLWVPTGTPRTVIDAINKVVTEGMHSPQMVKRLEADGSLPADSMTPAELRKTLEHEYVEISQQVKKLNLKIQ